MGALKDKVVIVTGASSGIGRATAVALAAEGAKVVASARREAQGRELVAAVKDRGGEITWVTADMRVEGDVEALVKAAVSTYGRLDLASTTPDPIRYRSPTCPTPTTTCHGHEPPRRLLVHEVPDQSHARERRPRSSTCAPVAASRFFPGSAVYAASKAGLVAAHAQPPSSTRRRGSGSTR